MQKIIRIIDVPLSATAEESERLLNQVCEDGYYLVTLTPHMMGLRGYFRRRVRQAKDADNGPALDLLRAHPEMSCRAAAQMLTERGFPHKKDWVFHKRKELERAS